MKMKRNKSDSETRGRGDAETRRQKQTADGSRQSAGKKIVAASRFLAAAVFLSMLLSFGCTYRSFENQNVAAAPPNENKQSSLESDLQTMQTANFEFIFVFRRKDGGAFDGGDRKYLRANAPAETNRFIATDDGRAFIVGSKYLFPPSNLEALRMRFNIEDYSTAGRAK